MVVHEGNMKESRRQTHLLLIESMYTAFFVCRSRRDSGCALYKIEYQMFRHVVSVLRRELYGCPSSVLRRASILAAPQHYNTIINVSGVDTMPLMG